MKEQLFPLQDEGARILATRDRFGLHDEMGVGKTATTWRAAEYINASRGIVVCPAHLRENWVQEFRKFGNWPWRICKLVNIHDFYAWQRGKFDMMVMSYEGAVKHAKQIRLSGEPLDFVAFDEAHYMKNTSTTRTKSLAGMRFDGVGGLFEFSRFVWHITGTPMANDPLDIYVFLRMCRCLGDMTEGAFTKTFFHVIKTSYGSRQVCRPEMIAPLQALINNNSIRRTKADLGFQLPPIFLTSAVVDGDTQHIAQMLRAHPDLERAIFQALDQGGLSFLDAPYVATLRRLLGEAKAVPYAHMLLEELLSGSDKRVVFGIHIDALTYIRDFLIKHGIRCVLINGTVSEKDRIAAVHEFQNDPNCQVILGNMRAAGTGYTFTAACEIDVFESDWSPSGNAQAIMRVHRIGQWRNVRARFITLARTFDEVVNRVVAAKTAAIAQAHGGAAMHAAPLELLQQFV